MPVFRHAGGMLAVIALCGCMTVADAVWADNLRRASPIAPHRHVLVNTLPDGFQALSERHQGIDIPQSDVEQALEQIVEAWNAGTPAPFLAEGFRDKSRLNWRIGTELPIDARLTLVAVSSWAPLNAIRGVDGEGRQIRVVNVRAVAKTRVEYLAPGQGLQQLEGENEYYLRLLYEVSAP